MATQLHDMEIEEISLVDDGANPGAKVEIWKAKFMACEGCKSESLCKAKGKCMGDEGGGPMKKSAGDGQGSAGLSAAMQQEIMMNLEELSAALEQAEAKLDTLEKAKTDAEAKVADLEGVVKAKDARITELEGTVAKSMDPLAADEAFLKSMPEPAREAILKARQAEADAKAQLAKAREAQDTAEAITKAKALNFGKPEDVGPLLMRVAKGLTTKADADALEALLKSAGEVASKSPLFKALGSGAAVEGDPDELLKAKAAEIKKARPELTAEQAYAEAVDKNPELYSAYIAKRRTA